MPKAKNSPPSPPVPTLVNSQDERAARAKLAAAFSFVSDKGLKVRLSLERAEALAMKRADRLITLLNKHREIRARAAEAMRDNAARIRYLREQRAADRAIERFWRRFFAKPRGIKRRATPPSRKRQTGTMPAGSIRLPAYQGAVIDRLGRQGVFVAVRYYGSKRARIGVARRLVLYITRPDALECDEDGNPTILTNVGDDIAEQATAFDLIETLARSSRDNAKVVFSMVVNLPHDVSPQARRQILESFCAEAFGLHDLPYVATIHTPPPEGDARNFHAHIAFALRPMHRIGYHEWDVSPRLATEFDGEARFAYLRALFAQTMTEVTRAHGKNRVYTHLSNAARGLRALPLSPLGPALTQAVRDGDIVGANERNRKRIADNEALLAKDRARWRAERKAERDAIDARYRQISLPTSRAALPPLPPAETNRAAVPADIQGLPTALPEFATTRTSRMPALPLAARTRAAPQIRRRPPLPALGEHNPTAIDPTPLRALGAMPSPSRRSNSPLPVLSMDVPIRSGLSQRMADILLLVEQALARRAERQVRKQREAARRQRPAAPDISDG